MDDAIGAGPCPPARMGTIHPIPTLKQQRALSSQSFSPDGTPTTSSW
jgi:hypothetical protein